MLRKILLFAMLLVPSLALAQGGCLYNQALTSRQGFSNLAAVVPQAIVTAAPGPIYRDAALSSIIAGNQVTADAYGNYSFCAAPSVGIQIVTVNGPNLNTLTYSWNPGQIYSASGTWTGANNFSGTTSFSGTTNFSGPTTFSITPIFGTIVTAFVQAPNGSNLNLQASNPSGSCGSPVPCGGFETFLQGGGATGGGITIQAGLGFVSPGGNIVLNPGTGTPNGTILLNGLVSAYNGRTLQGAGLVSNVCATSQKVESALDTNILSCIMPLVGGRWRLAFTMDVSAQSAATLGWTATWTDANGHAQAPTNLSLFTAGTAAPALTVTAVTNGHYYGYVDIDVDNSGTTVIVKLTFTGTSFTAKVSATAEQLI